MYVSFVVKSIKRMVSNFGSIVQRPLCARSPQAAACMLSVLCELEAECDLSHPLLTVLLYPMPLPCIAIATARLSLYFYMFRSRVFAYSSLETYLPDLTC
jgi:hypothetical protein